MIKVLAEQGSIYWANHENNYKHMVGSALDMHYAVKGAKDFVDKPGDDIAWDNTMIIVTADHANSYMRIVKPSKLKRGQLVSGN